MNTTNLHLSRPALAAACLALVAGAPTPAFADQQGAAARHSACPAPKPAKPKRKGLGLSGLLSAARNAGVGDMLGAGVLGDDKAAQVAGTAAGVAMNGGNNPASVIAGLAGSGRTAQAVGVAVSTATEFARQAPSGC